MGINSFNTGFNPSAPLVAAGGAAPAQGTSQVNHAHHHHGMHRDGVSLAGGNPQLSAGIQSLRQSQAQLDRQMAAYANEAQSTTSQLRLSQIDAKVGDLARTRSGLDQMIALATKMNGQRPLNQQAVDQMSALMAESQTTTSYQRHAQIMVLAEDLARNAGRRVPTDRGMVAQQLDLANFKGQIVDEMKAMAEEAQTTTSQQRLSQIQMKMSSDAGYIGSLDNLKGQADKLSDNPAASPLDIDTMKGLMAEAETTTSQQRLGQLQTQAEDIARNAGRSPMSDRGLAAATSDLVSRSSTYADDIKALAQEAQGAVSQQRLTQIQMAIDNKKGMLDNLQALKGEADKLADNANASPADVQKMTALLQEAASTTSPQRQATILASAQQLVRHNDGWSSTSPALDNALMRLADRQGRMASDMAALNDEGQQNVSQRRLTQIQIKADDDKREADLLGQLRGEGDRVAKGGLSITDQDADHMARLLVEAAGTTSQQRLSQIALEASRIGR